MAGVDRAQWRRDRRERIRSTPEGLERDRAYARERARVRREARSPEDAAWITAKATRRTWLARLERLGLDEAGYEALLLWQGGRCAGCYRDEPGWPGGAWPVDHDHDTGQPRGLLCHRCNTGLGLLGDDPSVLRRLADYAAVRWLG